MLALRDIGFAYQKGKNEYEVFKNINITINENDFFFCSEPINFFEGGGGG